MLYDLTMFWDGRHALTANAESSIDGSVHWVRVKADDAATTTVFVSDRAAAERLAALINEIATPQIIEARAA